ncbi:MAG TPA: hypothetical protein VNC50_12680, partial [Planctomycetia bacterium]|nr:hypothetical protein [Planctomycetia bacterium]
MSLLLGIMLGGGAGAAVWYLLPQPKVSAASVIEILVTAPAVVANSTENREFTSFQRALANQVKLRRVFTAALRDLESIDVPGLTQSDDPYGWLEDNIKVDFKLGREYLRISSDGRLPEPTLAVVKAVTKSFLFEARDKEKLAKAQNLARLKKLAESYKQKLITANAVMRSRVAGGGAPNDRVSAMRQEIKQENLVQAQRELTQVHSEIRRLSIELAGAPAAKPAVATPTPEHMVMAEMEKDPEIVEERKKLADLEAAYKTYEDSVKPGITTPAMEELKAAIVQQKERVAQAPESLKKRASERARSKFLMQVAGTAATVQDRLSIYKRLEVELTREVEELAGEVKRLGVEQHDIEQDKRYIGSIERFCDALNNNIESLEIERDAPERITEFQEPQLAPRLDDRRKRLMMALAAAFLGLLAPAVPVFAFEMRKRRVLDKDQVAAELGVEIVGTIPHIASRRRS